MTESDLRSFVCVAVLGASVLTCVADEAAPTAEERAAQADLNAYGARLGVRVDSAVLAHVRAELPPAVVAALDATKSDEAFALVRDGSRVRIIGRSPLAVRYGAVALLEDYGGVRFFHAGPGGTVVDASAVRRIPDDLLDVRVPCVGYRRLMHRRASVEDYIPMSEYREWMVRRSYQVTPRESSTGEAIDAVLPLSLFDTHPEYFPLIEGKRSLEVARRSQRRCLTNPDVVRLMSDYIVAHCRKENAHLLSEFTVPGDWCQCESCRKAGTGDDGYFREEVYVHRVHAAIARAVLAKMPDARLCAQAYQGWRFPPNAADLVYDARVPLHYCPIGRCYAHPLSASCNDSFRKAYEQWHQHAPTIGAYGWSSVSNMRYSPMVRVFARDFKWLRERDFGAWLEGVSTPVEKLSMAIGCWRLYYVASKLMWQSDLDIETLLAETDRLYYGVAYGPMRKYQALRQKIWDEAEGHAVANAPPRYPHCLANAQDEAELRALLTEAERLAGADAELKARLAIDRRGLEAYWIAGARKLREERAAYLALPREEREVDFVRLEGTTGTFPTESQWAAAPTRPLYAKERRAPREGTRVRLAADRANWFVRFEADYDGQPVCKAFGRDGEVWKDDAVEFMARPPRGDYVHVIVNAQGRIYDTLGAGGVDYAYGGDIRQTWRGKTLVTDIRLPVAPIPGVANGTDGVWRFRFSRDNPRSGEWSDLGSEWREGNNYIPKGKE